MKIGMFDSGVGGLTVLKEIVNKYPNNQYFYYGDSANIPYGTKTIEQLRILVDRVIKFLIKKEVDMIIIACGTVSATLYDELIKKYNIPIYDVINPTVNYINSSRYSEVGLIATPATINSGIFQEKIEKNIKVQACPLFVPLIEEGRIDSTEMDKALNEYLDIFKTTEILILGCTHYPLLEGRIGNILPTIKLINMGSILADNLNLESKDFSLRLYFSKIDHNLIRNIESIISFDYQLEEIINA